MSRLMKGGAAVISIRNVTMALLVAVAAVAGAPQPSRAQACGKQAAALFKDASPSVVFISVRSINPYRLRNRVTSGLGTGFLFDPRGLILTNAHVVLGAQSILVTLDNGSTHQAKLVGIDPIFDLAVLGLASAVGQPPGLTMGESSTISVGDPVVAIGNPLGLDQTLTTGVISALNRILPESPLSLTRRMIQTDAAINPGNSGGPLLDDCGRVIGVNTAIIAGAQNLGFAVPIDLVKSVLPSLISKGRVLRPWIGFHGTLIDTDLGNLLRMPLVAGLLVEVIEPDSPAEKKGIRGGQLDVSIGGQEILIGGDIVTDINGIKLDSPDALRQAMEGLKVGERIQLTLSRDGKIQKVDYKLPERPFLPGDIAN